MTKAGALPALLGQLCEALGDRGIFEVDEHGDALLASECHGTLLGLVRGAQWMARGRRAGRGASSRVRARE